MSGVELAAENTSENMNVAEEMEVVREDARENVESKVQCNQTNGEGNEKMEE